MLPDRNQVKIAMLRHGRVEKAPRAYTPCEAAAFVRQFKALAIPGCTLRIVSRIEPDAGKQRPLPAICRH
jgi:hypothetical protein